MSAHDEVTVVRLVPPQTSAADDGAPTPPTSGCHTLVIDISYSMDDEAKVTNDDGDKVDFGWCVALTTSSRD